MQVDTGASGNVEHWVVAKGAPEVIREHLADPSADYASYYKTYAAQGARCRTQILFLRIPVHLPAHANGDATIGEVANLHGRVIMSLHGPPLPSSDVA